MTFNFSSSMLVFLVGDALYGFEYFQVAGATAKIAAKSLFDLRPGRMRMFLEQRLCDKENPGNAIAALGSAEICKRGLQGIEFRSLRHSLNGGDVLAL